MSLPIDYKIDKIIKQIQVELKNEHGVEISYNTIFNVINQQIKSTINGMENGHTIVWKYFGSFVATQKRVDMLNKSYIKKGKRPTLIDSGFHRVALDRKGNKLSDSTFSPSSVRDLIPKIVND